MFTMLLKLMRLMFDTVNIAIFISLKTIHIIFFNNSTSNDVSPFAH